jgi:serine/threonine protein kinase
MTQVSKRGQVLAGKYRLSNELGRGGMGSVWSAEHLTLHSQVALKLIESTHPQGENGAAQFLREARLAAALNSQHIVKIFDYGVAEHTPFIAMELLDGETLRRRLQRVGRLGLEELQKVVRQVSYGMERAHRAGIVHRDLKPENVFIVTGDEGELIKVLDFGIAKSTASSLADSIASATPTGAVLGTPHYMSPEQAMGSRDLDHRTDLWSLGVLAFECLLGQQPFRGETLGALIVAVCSQPLPVPSERGEVPMGFDAWFARACARDAAQRFASARELSDALGALLPSGAATAASRAVGSEPRHRSPPGAATLGAAPPSAIEAAPNAARPAGPGSTRLSPAQRRSAEPGTGSVHEGLRATARISAGSDETSRFARPLAPAQRPSPVETTLAAVELAHGGAWQRWKVASVSVMILVASTLAVWALRASERSVESSAAAGETPPHAPSANATPRVDTLTERNLPSRGAPPKPEATPDRPIEPVSTAAQTSPQNGMTPPSLPPAAIEQVVPGVERGATSKARRSRADPPASKLDAKAAESRRSGSEPKPAPDDPYQLGF